MTLLRQQRSYLAAIFTLLLLVACAGQPTERVLYDDGAAAVLFSGRMQGEVPSDGELRFDSNGTAFVGSFDPQGFPKEGVLQQSYLDSNGERLQLSLRGKFRQQSAHKQLRFRGQFELRDSQGRLLAGAQNSRWLSPYPATVFRVPPPLFVMAGEQEYHQYRHDISPASEPRRFLRVYRPMSGPFVVKLRYEDGLPRGMAQVKRELSSGERYIVERQYFNYQLPERRSHYYYFEPGSFERVTVVGGCEAPNLTVPQQLLSVYAFDCAGGNFLALSEAMPASVLSIASDHLDNSGRFHKIRIHHHGSSAEFDVDTAALLQGELRSHGLYMDWHYGQLREAYHADHGRPVGIGIEQKVAGEPRYVSHVLDEALGAVPDEGKFSQLKLAASAAATALDDVFKRKASSGSLSERRARALLEALSELFAAQPPLLTGEYPGLLSLYQQWQHESLALLQRWPWQKRRNAKDIDTLRRALKAKQQHYAEQQQQLLGEQAQRYCASQGQSFDAVRWQCKLRADGPMHEICQRAYGLSRCEQMQARLSDSEGQ